MSTPIGILFGTRPEYLKCKPLISAFQARNIDFQIIHIKQHKDLDIEEKVFPNYNLIELQPELGVSRLNELASSIPKHLESVLSKCNSLLVQGDTATAFFGCITAFHLGKPVIHLEAGLRTYDLANPFPEEAYRSMISRIATIHLCPDEQAAENLRKENIHKNIFVIGNTILDLVKSYKFESSAKNFVMITIHRRENWDSLPGIAEEIYNLAMERTDLQFIWIYHPNPLLQEKVKKVIDALKTINNLQFEQPCKHKDLCQYIHAAHSIITDSGGIQEEASFVGKYCFVLRKITERNSIPPMYIETIDSPENLRRQFQKKQIEVLPPCTVYGKGDSSDKIAEIIYNLNQKRIEL